MRLDDVLVLPEQCSHTKPDLRAPGMFRWTSVLRNKPAYVFPWCMPEQTAVQRPKRWHAVRREFIEWGFGADALEGRDERCYASAVGNGWKWDCR